MTKLQQLKKHLRPGRVYRREELAQWSNAVDRQLKQLVHEGTLTKLGGGLYLYPKNTVFGKAPAEDDRLVGTFLKNRRFLLASPNAYNSLGVGATQLYDKTVVYNHKRHGQFSFGGRTFDFRVKPSFPKTLSKEFLLVDLVNNLDRLAESKTEVLARVKERAASYDVPRLRRAARDYGNVRTKRFFTEVLKSDTATLKGFSREKMLPSPPGESMSAHHQNATATVIRDLARKHNVACVGTRNDALAHHITRLAGDHVELDEVEQLLIALQRAGHLSRMEIVRLQARYLREAKP